MGAGAGHCGLAVEPQQVILGKTEVADWRRWNGCPMGRMVTTVLGMVAEMRLGFIRERGRVGTRAATANCVYKGRPVTLDHPRILTMWAEGGGATEIANSLQQFRCRLACPMILAQLAVHLTRFPPSIQGTGR